MPSTPALRLRGHADVPLHWQVWRLRSPRVERISAAIRAAARTCLQPITG